MEGRNRGGKILCLIDFWGGSDHFTFKIRCVAWKQVELQDVSAVVGIGLHRASRAVTVFTYNAAQANYMSYVWDVVSDSRSRGGPSRPLIAVPQLE
jgi:hypothetical protein